jgi:hypothetical protein
MTTAQRTAKIVKALPPEKAEAVLDYAQYLAGKTDEQAWDRSFRRARKSPRFRKLLAEVEQDIQQGRTQPLNLDQL